MSRYCTILHNRARLRSLAGNNPASSHARLPAPQVPFKTPARHHSSTIVHLRSICLMSCVRFVTTGFWTLMTLWCRHSLTVWRWCQLITDVVIVNANRWRVFVVTILHFLPREPHPQGTHTVNWLWFSANDFSALWFGKCQVLASEAIFRNSP